MKHKLIEIIAFLCYILRIDNLFYFLNKKSKRIVTFHNVIPQKLLPHGKRIGLVDTEMSFQMKMHEIKRHFYITTDLNDNEGLTITFDDGYCNQYDVAAPLMDGEKGIIFACGKLYDNKKYQGALIVDLLMHWIWLVPNGTYDINCPKVLEKRIVVNTTNRGMLWQKVVWPSFLCDNETKGDGLLKALDKAFPIQTVLETCSDEYLKLRLTGFNITEIEAIRNDGWLIGWHTQEHYPLSKLNDEEKQQEIDFLAPETTKFVPFSYPYGELLSVDSNCIRIARNAGFPCAVSNMPDLNEMSGKYFLPRITLPDNKYLLHFELSGVKYFLKNHKLMPHCV